MSAPAPLWLCISLPTLGLDALAAGDAEPPPRALVDSRGNQRWIGAVNAAADAAGICRGQPLASALARLPGLQLQPREARRERALLEQLALWAWQFSSQLSLAPPDRLLLEIGASLRLFGGQRALCERVAAGLRELGYTHRLGVAPTPLGAELGAALGWPPLRERRALRARLACAPLAALPLSTAVIEALQRSGLRRAGALFALPRAALARRVGPAALDALDRLCGARADPRPRFSPPPHFDQRLSFLYEVEQSSALGFPLKRLIAALAGQLHAVDAGVAQLQLSLLHPRSPPTAVAVRLLEVSGDAARLLRVARERLEQLALDEPVRGLRLRAERFEAVERGGGDLFATRTGSRALADVLEQWQARLGEGRVYRLALIDEHRPEHSGQRLAPGEAPPPRRDAAAAQLPPRPLWLLAAPRPAPPGLALEAGPWERIECGWWEADDVRRDYAVARDARGLRHWVFRRRGGAKALYLHGLFG